MRRLGRLAVRLTFGAAVLVLVLLLLLWGASRLPAVQELLRARLVSALEQAVDGKVTIGALGGTLGRTIVLEDVRIGTHDRPVLHVPRIEVTYAVFALVHRRVQLDRVILESPRAWLVHSHGRFQLPGARGSKEPEQPAKGGGQGVEIRIGRLDVRGARAAVAFLDTDPPRRFALTELGAAGSARFGGGHAEVELESLGFRPRGVPLSRVEAAGELVMTPDGGLVVPRLFVATTRSRVEGSARMVRGTALDARLALAPLDARDVRAILPTSPLRANVALRVEANGPWSAVTVGARAELDPGGRLRSAGVVDLGAHPPRYAITARVAALDPGAAARGLVSADLGGRVRASGAGTGRDVRLAWQLHLDPSRIASQRVNGVRLRGRADGLVHHARGTVAVPAGQARLRTALRLGRSPAYRAAGRLAIDDLAALTPSLPGWARARVAVAGRGFTPAARSATLRARLDGATVRGVQLERGAVDVGLAGQSLDVPRAELEGPGLRVAVHGQADLAERHTDVALVADAELGTIGAGTGTSAAGTLHAEAGARGRFDALTVTATVTADAPAYTETSARNAHAQLDLAGVGGPSAHGTLILGASEVRVGSRAPQQVAASVDWRRERTADVARIDVEAHDEAGAVQRLALALHRLPAATRGEVRDLVLTPPESRPWQLTRPTRFTLDDAFRVEPLTLVAGGQQVTLAGRIATNETANDASLGLREVALGPLCAVAKRPPCAGRLSGDVRLTGTATAPRIDGHLTASRLRVSEAEYGTLDLDAAYAERRATLRAVLRNPQAGEVDLDGTIPVDLAWRGPRTDVSALPIDLRVRATELDVSIVPALAPQTIRHASGALTADLAVTGPRNARRADGDIAFDGGLELTAAGVRYEPIHLRATARGQALEVRRLSARSGDGTLEGEGRVGLASGGETELGVKVRLDKFLAIRRQAFEAAASGEVAARGTLTALAVTGDLDVDRAVVRPAELPATGPALERDRTIILVNAPGGATDRVAAPAPEATPPLADSLRLAVHVRVARNAWIRRADANIEIAGDLRVDKAPFGPVRIVGQIRLVRGWYQFQGRKFTIDEGTITFTGNSPPLPTFDVRASYKTQQYNITIHIEGSTEKPHLTLSSEPPLEQADILAVILFGKPTGQLGRGQNLDLQRQALQLAGGYVMPELRTSVMNTLGVDALDVELPEGTDRPGKLSVGRYVAGDVFVSLAQEFGSRSAEWVSVEYPLTPNISLRGSSSTRGESAVDLFWRRRY